ncbi:rfwd3 protein [Anaeramoeba flamelloides]|uniref:RING-type E3 ubiquitin transferase n=1 Tax=Anaeramoeba flamelloides TaxID=1746091 RepID=A0ABQ8XQ17_9EUKA|nr:rfwd3 protein [Anaeramoeba flamelloides]
MSSDEDFFKKFTTPILSSSPSTSSDFSALFPKNKKKLNPFQRKRRRTRTTKKKKKKKKKGKGKRKKKKQKIKKKEHKTKKKVKKQKEIVSQKNKTIYCDQQSGFTLCVICKKSLSNSGQHQICSLVCGHLFGKSCINEYIKQCSSNKKKALCPICEKPCKQCDVQKVFAKVVLNNGGSESVELKKKINSSNQKLQSLLKTKTRLQEELGNLKYQYTTLLRQQTFVGHKTKTNDQQQASKPMAIYKHNQYLPSKQTSKQMDQISQTKQANQTNETNQIAQSKLSQTNKANGIKKRYRLNDLGSFKYSPNDTLGGTEVYSNFVPKCVNYLPSKEIFVLRDCLPVKDGLVMDLSQELNLAIFSEKTKSGSMYGITKVHCLNTSFRKQMPLHSDPISDLSCWSSLTCGDQTTSQKEIINKSNLYSDLVLTVSLDRSLSLTSMNDETVVLKHIVGEPLSSCAFDLSNTNIFYCGHSSGLVSIFDIRNTRTHTHQWKASIQSNFPTNKIHHVWIPNSTISGILTFQSDVLNFWYMINNQQYNFQHAYKQFIGKKITYMTFDQQCQAGCIVLSDIYNRKPDSILIFQIKLKDGKTKDSAKKPFLENQYFQFDEKLCFDCQKNFSKISYSHLFFMKNNLYAALLSQINNQIYLYNIDHQKMHFQFNFSHESPLVKNSNINNTRLHLNQNHHSPILQVKTASIFKQDIISFLSKEKLTFFSLNSPLVNF